MKNKNISLFFLIVLCVQYFSIRPSGDDDIPEQKSYKWLNTNPLKNINLKQFGAGALAATALIYGSQLKPDLSAVKPYLFYGMGALGLAASYKIMQNFIEKYNEIQLNKMINNIETVIEGNILNNRFFNIPTFSVRYPYYLSDNSFKFSQRNPDRYSIKFTIKKDLISRYPIAFEEKTYDIPSDQAQRHSVVKQIKEDIRKEIDLGKKEIMNLYETKF